MSVPGGTSHEVGDDHHVAVSGRPRGQQHPNEGGHLHCEDVEGLMDVAVGGLESDRVVDGELAHPHRISQPAQEQHRVVEGPQPSPAAPGAAHLLGAVQQLGDVGGRGPGEGQHSAVGDNIRHGGTPGGTVGL